MEKNIFKSLALLCSSLIVITGIGCKTLTSQSLAANTQVNDSVSWSAKKEKQKIMDYLSRIKGKRVIGGIHNREPNSEPARWTNAINKLVGRYPKLWSGDFLFQQENIDHRSTMIDEAISQFHQGAIVNIMWHACNPVNGQPCSWDDGRGVLSHLTDSQWENLFIEGTLEHGKLVSMMEEIAVYLKRLKDNKVIALFRPFHEMNQGKFWWGGRPGEKGTARLYRYVHDFMVKKKELDNLIWVWNVQDFQSLDTDVELYNPGRSYWDIVSLDVYDDHTGFSNEKYGAIDRVAAGRPMAIGECQVLPSLEVLKDQPNWVFFMGWSELVFEKNSEAKIKALYGSDQVIMLGE